MSQKNCVPKQFVSQIKFGSRKNLGGRVGGLVAEAMCWVGCGGYVLAGGVGGSQII